MRQHIFHAMGLVLAAALVIGTAAPVVAAPAHAGLVTTHDVLAHEQGNLDRSSILAVLERSDVRERLVAHGVAVADVEARVAALTDAEARAMAERLDALPAGAASGWAILGGILLVLVITDLLGVTNVFPFIN